MFFARSLVHLFRYAASSDLYSYVILVPFISAYLVWTKRASLPKPAGPDLATAAGFVALAAALRLYVDRGLPARGLSKDDALFLTTLTFVALFAGICAMFLGRPLVRALRFPLLFLFLMVPAPTTVTEFVESLLQYGSAAVALAFFKISGTTVFSHDLTFDLPGISIQVAPECSGIHSTLALFVTSLLAGYLFLRSYGRRCVLTLVVLPLALIRNGFRVYVIGELCVHFGSDMIDSYIHKHGGPIFFALSLIPFIAFLFYLVRSEPVLSTRPTHVVDP